MTPIFDQFMAVVSILLATLILGIIIDRFAYWQFHKHDKRYKRMMEDYFKRINKN